MASIFTMLPFAVSNTTLPQIATTDYGVISEL